MSEISSTTSLVPGTGAIVGESGRALQSDPLVKKGSQQIAEIFTVAKRHVGHTEDYKQRDERNPPGIVSKTIDPTLLMSIVSEVFNKLDEKQLAAFADELEKSQARSEKILDSKLEKVETQFKKQVEAKELERKNQIASDVQLGLGVAMTIFGILASILTAGAMSGLMIAGVALGATMTAGEVVNRGLKAGEVKYDDPLDKTGHKKNQLDISIGGLVRMAVDDAAANNRFAYPDEIRNKGEKAMEKYRNEVIMGVSIFISIAVAALSIGLSAGGIVALKNAAKAAQDGASIAKDTATNVSKLARFSAENASNIQMLTQSTEIGADMINLGSSIYQGANTIVMADTKLDMHMAEAEANRLGAFADAERAGIERINTAARNTSSNINESKKIIWESKSMLNTLSLEMIQID